jgi:very-short-patch-repair endonuclease
MFRTKTTEEFIKLAKERHGDRYDYSKSVYLGCKIPLIISCPDHGDFSKTPDSHTKKNKPSGCPKCGYVKRSKSNTKTTEQFITEAKEVHGDTYDYSKVVYVGAHIKVIIICKLHEEFSQQPDSHLQGYGCKKCGIIKQAKSLMLTTEKYIRRAKEVHGDTYDYSKVVYVDSRSRVIIICRIHNEFLQVAASHLQGHGCKKCAVKIMGLTIRLSFEEFLQRARAKHGDKYIYDNVNYVNCDTPVEIICRFHGDFMQTPDNHIYAGAGCKICGEIQRIIAQTCTVGEFIEKAIFVHSGKYTYEKVKYVRSHEHIEITCKKHGDFLQTPANHLQGKGCYECGCEKLNKFNVTNTEEFILKAKEIHGDTYDYTNSTYSKYNDPLEIICKRHGLFYQKVSRHLSGGGCACCKNKTEGKLLNWLKANEFIIEYQKKFDWCKNDSHLSFDFYIQSLGIIIELDGIQHFFQVSNWRSPEDNQIYDNLKMKLANGNGLSVIRIYQPDVWDNKNNWDSQLLNVIKKYDSPTNICIGNMYEEYYDTKQINLILNNSLLYSSALINLMLITLDSANIYRPDEPSNVIFEIISESQDLVSEKDPLTPRK